ncbi:MAG: lysozyme inhibitor LprI family protein [Roseibium sp.]
MTLKTLVAATVALVFSGFTAQAEQPVDCGYPLNETERAFCAEEALKKAEVDLGKAYLRAIAKLTELDKALADDQQGSPAALEEAQNAWRDYRDKDCAAYSYPFRAETRGDELYRGCMIVMTMQRTDDLDAMVEDYGN